MNKILNKIEKNLRGMNKPEVEEVLQYYEEIISDRLENGESIEQINNSIDYNEIRKIYVPKSINTRNNETIKESANTSKTLLLFLLTSPILIPLAILYFVIVFVIYVLITSFLLTMMLVPLSGLLIPIDMIVSGNGVGDIMIGSGVVILIVVLIEYLLLILNRLLLKVNNYFIRVFSKFVLRKDK